MEDDETMDYEELLHSDNLFSSSQLRVLFIVPMITGSLSFIGSSIIIFIICRDWKMKMKRLYHRFLFGFSCADCVVSLNYALSSTVVPKGTPGVWKALGSWETCEASGFFMQFAMSRGLYSASICVYYVLILRCNVQERTIKKRLEPFVHVLAFFGPLTMGILMLALDMYNPTNITTGHCFINAYPANCIRVEEVACERGESYFVWSLILNIYFIILFGIVVATSILTYEAIRKVHRNQHRWSFSSRTVSSISRPPANGYNNTRQAFIQVVLYILSFFLTYIAVGTISFSTLSYDGVEANRSYYFPLVLSVKIFFPSQGTWNFFIYIRPRFRSLVTRNPNASSIAILRQIVLGGDDRWRSRRSSGGISSILLQPSPSLARPPRQQSGITAVISSSQYVVDDDRFGREVFTPELGHQNSHARRVPTVVEAENSNTPTDQSQNEENRPGDGLSDDDRESMAEQELSTSSVEEA